MMRTGAEYLRSLKDGRARLRRRRARQGRHRASGVPPGGALDRQPVWTSRRRRSMRERMTFTSPKTGEPVWRAWQIPHTHADLRARRLFSETWAEATFGLMGRTPDHVAGFFCGYAATPQVLAAGGQKFADNVVAFYEYMRDNHIYASYAIVPPQIDRSKPAHKQSDPTLYAGVVKERDDGIVISGAQQLATGGVLSDYIHLSCIHPLATGRRELRQLRRHPGRRRRREALSAPAVRARRQRLRLSAVEPVRQIRQLRHLRQRVRAVGARVHLSQSRRSAATSGGRRRRICSAIIRRRCAT